MTISLRMSFIILLTLVLAACGANKKTDAVQDDAEPLSQTDITRPPVFVKRGDDNVEGNPEETISLDEWQKQQQQGSD